MVTTWYAPDISGAKALRLVTDLILIGLTIRLAQSLGLHCELPSSEPGAVQTVKSSIWCEIIEDIIPVSSHSRNLGGK